MKLTQESSKQLKTLLQTVSIVKMEKLIIDNGVARGIDEDQTVLIISDVGIPDLGGARIGMNRLSAIVSRINLLDSNADFVIETVEAPARNGEGNDISVFKISGKGSKFEYRAARPEMIKAPKKINDVMEWKISIPQDVIKVVIAASNSMDSEQIGIVSKSSGEVLFEITNGDTKDTFTTVVSEEAEYLGEEDSPSQSFVHYYAEKTLTALLKAAAVAGPAVVSVGQDGMLQITVNGHMFTLLPREEG